LALTPCDGLIAAVDIGVQIQNAGKVPLTYAMQKFDLELSGSKGNDDVYLSRSGTILPGGSTLFLRARLTLAEPRPFPVEGRTTYEFEYWSP
jgi:hypothetical protein